MLDCSVVNLAAHPELQLGQLRLGKGEGQDQPREQEGGQEQGAGCQPHAQERGGEQGQEGAGLLEQIGGPGPGGSPKGSGPLGHGQQEQGLQEQGQGTEGQQGQGQGQERQRQGQQAQQAAGVTWPSLMPRAEERVSLTIRRVSKVVKGLRLGAR